MSGGVTDSPTTATGVETRPCDPWLQDCPDGEKCAPYAADPAIDDFTGAKCVPIDADARTPGEPCTAVDGGLAGIDDCGAAALCWDVDGDDGICHPLCSGSAREPVCPEGSYCGFSNTAAVCVRTCDPVDSLCTQGDEICVASFDRFECARDENAAARGMFEACVGADECAVGLACVDAKFGSGCAAEGLCCLAYCHVSMPTACSGLDGTCKPWFAEGFSLPEFADIGVCTVVP